MPAGRIVARRNSSLVRRKAEERRLFRSGNFSVARLVEFMQIQHTGISMVVVLVYLCIELVCIAFYIWAIERGTPEQLNEMQWHVVAFWTEVGVSIAFVFEWICVLFVRHDKISYIFSLFSLVDFLTCFPMTVLGLMALFNSSRYERIWVPMYLRVWYVGRNLNLLLQFREIAWRMGAYEKLFRFSITLLSIMVSCVGTFQIIESVTGGSITFFNATYMMVITFGTIGYGDVHPTTTPARLFAIIFIILGLCYFLPFMSLLATAGEKRLLYDSYTSSNRNESPHVIICGEFADRAVEILLMNFYAGWRRYLSTKIVLMSPRGFSNEVRMLVHSPWFRGRVLLLTGEPSHEPDLQRADAHNADAIFLCGNAGSSAYYYDYQVISQSLVVALYDPVLPQHILLRRLPSHSLQHAGNVLEMEKFVQTLMGMGLVLPGVVPLLMNLLRTYETFTVEIRADCDWVEQYEYSLRQDLITVPVLDSLRWMGFVSLAKEFYEREATLIGVLDFSQKVVLNPVGELIGNARKLIVIARSLDIVLEATKDIATMLTENFGEEMLHVSNVERNIQSAMTYTKPFDNTSSSSQSSSSSSFDSDDDRSSRCTSHQPNPSPPADKRLFIQVQDAMNFENHVVIVDLSAAKSPAEESQFASESMVSGAAHDILLLLAPVQKICPHHDIVVLSCDAAQFPYLEAGLYERRRNLKKPVHYIYGCGLNISDLRRCNFEKCAGCCIFFSGDISREGSTSAMSLMVLLSIKDILNIGEGFGTPFPVMIELEGFANLSYFPPLVSDARLLQKSNRDYVFEPSYFVGNTLSRHMLFPILLRTYFVDEFLDVMKVMINGYSDQVPALGKALLSEFDAELIIYKDVSDYCLSVGYLPLGLHRLIEDPHNPSLSGFRFVLTNPPPALSVVQETDAIFFLAAGSSE